MRVAHFYLLVLCSLLVASAPAGPQATSSSGLTNLEEPERNLNLLEPSTIKATSFLKKRGTGPAKARKKSSSSGSKSKSKKSKEKSNGKDSKGEKGTVSDSPDKTSELIRAAAAERGVKLLPGQQYMFREEVKSKHWLVLVKVSQVNKKNRNPDFKIVKASVLKDWNTGEHVDVGNFKCKQWYGKPKCSKHKFWSYECSKMSTTHKISQKAKLFFFNKTDTLYEKSIGRLTTSTSEEIFAYKSTTETSIYEKCGKQFGHPSNTARKDSVSDEYYPGSWEEARD